MKLAFELGREVEVLLTATALANEVLTSARTLGYGYEDLA
jgi:hypothetical protein